MKLSWKKLTATLAVAAFSTLGLSAISPAQAATTPYVGAKITLVTPVLDASNTSEATKNQAMANGWVANGWFGEGLIYQRSWAPVGSKIYLTYHVADDKGAPLVGQTVILRCNKQYSDSRAQIMCDGVKAKDATSAADGGRVSRVTDAFGNVTFTVQNLDTEGETMPAKWTDAPIISEDGLDDIHAQFLPQIAGEKPDHSVITEFHFYNPTSTPTQPITSPTTRLAAPQLTDTNSIHRSDLETLFSVTNNWYKPGIGFRQVYAAAGSSTNLVYNVKDDNGAPLMAAPFKLKVGKAYSKSTAKVTNGTTATNTGAAENADQAVWETTTDAFGNVWFDFKSTDTVGEPVPASPTAPVPTTGAKFTQMWPEIAGANDVADMIEFHFYSAQPVAVAPVLKTAASLSGTAKVGSTITVNKGSWTGTPTPTYTYKWYRCTVSASSASTASAPSAAAKCAVISGKTTSTYKLTTADKYKYIRVLVTVKNSKGTKYSLTKTTGKVG